MPRHRELFEPGTPTEWLPDETLYSLCSRFHRLSGNHLAAHTCRALFGHPTQGSAHDFPSRVGHFAQVTHEALGDAESIIWQHTLLPYYLTCADPEVCDAAIQAMAGPSIGSLKFQLGLLTSRFRAHHPLKACPSCMQADRRDYGCSYWHREHQLPGYWICLEHHAPLCTSTLKATGVGRFHWILPDPEQLAAPAVDDPSPALMELARCAADWVLPMGRRGLDLSRLQATYRNQLVTLGLYRGPAARQLNLSAVGRAYVRHLASLRSVPELSALPNVPTAAAAEVRRLASRRGSASHPVRHLALISWLFGGLGALKASYDSHPIVNPEPATSRSDAPSTATEADSRRQAFLRLIKAGSSVSGAARQLGIDPSTGMAWATQVGVAFSRRASVLTPRVRARMIKSLRAGTNKTAVARRHAVSASSVERVLRTEPGLRAAWRMARHERQRKVARARWLRAAASSPRSGAKAIRLIEPAAFAWLYRHDRAWLDRCIAALPALARQGGLHVDWDQRDRWMADQVRGAVMALATDAPQSRIKLWQLYQRIPELKAKLRKLDRLPLTQRAIEQALGQTGRDSIADFQRDLSLPRGSEETTLSPS